MEGSSTAAEGSAEGVHKKLVMRRATLHIPHRGFY